MSNIDKINKILKEVTNKKIKSNIYVTMIHGKKDEVVPVKFSRYVLSVFSKAKKKLIVVKNGDHSLSNGKQLKIITRSLNKIVNNIF